MPNLFDPLRVGALELPNRVVMAPLTRLRAGPTRIVLEDPCCHPDVSMNVAITPKSDWPKRPLERAIAA